MPYVVFNAPVGRRNLRFDLNGVETFALRRVLFEPIGSRKGRNEIPTPACHFRSRRPVLVHSGTRRIHASILEAKRSHRLLRFGGSHFDMVRSAHVRAPWSPHSD